MKVTRELLKTIRTEINRALTEVGEAHGITLNLGNASYTDYDFTFKLKGAALDTGDGRSAAAAEWDLYRSRYGLDAIEYGDSFRTHSGTYTIDGIKPRSPKFPIIGIGVDGRRRKFPARAVLMGRKKEVA